MSTRRNFIKNVTGLTAGAGLVTAPFGSIAAEQPGFQKSANEKIGVALIGCNGMGWANLTSMLKNDNVECIALCDVDANVLNRRLADLEKMKMKKPQTYGDYRQLLQNKDVAAVIIGTPDHWHCLQMVHACEAGKDVYVEKPIANSIQECEAMVAAKNRYKRVVQVGQWQRSDPHWIGALDFLRSGALGKIRMARTWCYVSYGRNFQPKPDTAVPAGVDYDMWLGPAPERRFNPYRFHGSFRYFWDYAGGLMTDWGVHMIDMALAGMNLPDPDVITSAGGKIGYPGSAIETPDTQQTIFDYEKFSMVWEHGMGTGRQPFNRSMSSPGVAFTGNNGTLVIDRETWEVYPEVEGERYLTEALPQRQRHQNGLDLHTRNFVECIRSRNAPNCTIEMGRNAAVTAHLGNIAYRLKRQVRWNANKKAFTNDPEAAQLAMASYRAPWKIPGLGG